MSANPSSKSKSHGSPPPINDNQRDALTIIRNYDGAPHGAAIKEALSDARGSEVHSGVLYPTLDTLVDKGLVRKQDRDGRSYEYHLTDHGREVYDEYVRWVAPDE